MEFLRVDLACTSSIREARITAAATYRGRRLVSGMSEKQFRTPHKMDILQRLAEVLYANEVGRHYGSPPALSLSCATEHQHRAHVSLVPQTLLAAGRIATCIALLLSGTHSAERHWQEPVG
jgi:hypothetical protein